MRYSRIPGEQEDSHLVVETKNGAYDLTSVNEDLKGYDDLVIAGSISNRSVEAITQGLIEEAKEITNNDFEGDRLLPIIPDEVWAAGVTYQISEEAREEESESSDVYMKVYGAERPELFFKATPSRISKPNDPIGVRGDSSWDVPEPEMGIVLHRDEIVGFTLGNDVSSRSIEGENPLYLPQAKVYDRSCSLGPSITMVGDEFDPNDVEIAMNIYRDGDQVFEGSASTSEMVRSYEELVEYYSRHDSIPEWGVLLTGTTIVPPNDFTLKPGDTVEIEAAEIGVLRNHVVEV